MKYFKKVALLLCVASVLGIVSCTNTNTKTSGSGYIKTEVTMLYNKTCEYDDSGDYNENVYTDYQKGEKRSVPLFDFWYIDSASTNSMIPSFIMVGDRIKFELKEEVLADINDHSNIKIDPVEFKPITIDEAFNIEYIRAEVFKIEEASITRDESGYVLSISNYASQKYITIDKEYHYISLNEYNGKNVYVSSGNGIRLYSFNPLEE